MYSTKIWISTAAALGFALSAISAQAACRPERVEIKGDFGTARFTVEIADEPQERAVGLMNRPAMRRMAGMLFIYERPQPASFWMGKHTDPARYAVYRFARPGGSYP